MLTKLEVSGFKNLLDVSVEFGPFTCIAGPNGVGKSNLFDAIAFLSLLANTTIMEASQSIRVYRDRGHRAGDPQELFWTNGSERADRMRFAAEMLVPSEVKDDFGRAATPSTTFLRYELELGYEPPEELANLGRLILVHEALRHITKGDAPKHLRFPHSKRRFRDAVHVGRRSGKAFISTRGEGEAAEVLTHQDGGSGGRPRPSPAYTAPRTMVSTITSASDPTILAARREMGSWRMLALEPTALRAEDPFISPTQLTSNGSHLAASLYRLATTPDEDSEVADPDAVYSAIANRLSRLINVRAVRVDRDMTRRLLTLEVKEGKGGFLPARSLSDGTLRFLALCLIAADPTFTGTLCMEEPENGINPARLDAMVDLVRGLAVDPDEPPSAVNPMRQVIVNTHSPAFVAMQHRDDLLIALSKSVRRGESIATALALRPMIDTWRCTDTELGVGEAYISHYLDTRPGEQLNLVANAT